MRIERSIVSRESGKEQMAQPDRDEPGSSLLTLLTIITGREPTEVAAQEQQRLIPIVGVRLHRTKKDHMIPAIVAIDRPTLEAGHAIGEQWRSTETGYPIHASKFVVGRFRKSAGQRLL